ncbi:MAG: TonB-dependent receptor [Fibrobacteraceae bacterium]|nr:TonB-dependent receptor [Fibrobacteraceae bacterium]
MMKTNLPFFLSLLFIGGFFPSFGDEKNVVDLGEGVIAAEPNEKSQSSILKEDEVLNGEKLNRQFSNTLAETLRNEPGIAIRSMGPAPARPILKGLSGDHISIREDGAPEGDLSATSPDHAVATESLTLQDVSVIEGPNILLYSYSAAGGIIQINRNDIPFNEDSLHGTIKESAESGQPGTASSLSLIIPIRKASVKGEIAARKAGNMHTPSGTLKNTGLENESGAIGVSLPIKDWKIGTSFRSFTSDYGIPGGFIGGHPKGVDISLSKYDATLKALGPFMGTKKDSLELTLRINRYHHYEYESNNSIGAEFAVNEENFRAEIKRPKMFGLFDVSYGTDLDLRSIEMGGYVFTPPTSAYSGAFFGTGSFKPSNKTEITIAARGGGAFFYPESSVVAKATEIHNRKYLLGSFAAELLKRVGNGKFISIEFYRTSRAPTIEELYNQGPHLAAYTYEIGNKNLKAEEGYGSEVHFKGYFENWKIRSGIHLTWFKNYLTPRASGDTNWSQLLPIYKVQGGKAIMTGGEISAERDPERGIYFISTANYVRGWYYDENWGDMPQIPPFRLHSELAFKGAKFRAGGEATWNAEQNHVDKYEESTQASLILGLLFEKTWNMKFSNYRLICRIDNLLNAKAYNHLSRLKSIMPEKGRSFSAQFEINL